MSITRVFRVQIDPDLMHEFEQKFALISVQSVNKSPGLLSVVIFKPTKWAPYEFAMISQWDNLAVLKAFAGEKWNKPVIPSGMEKFVVECWIHHYESWIKPYNSIRAG